jgi:cysteine desulfurase
MKRIYLDWAAAAPVHPRAARPSMCGEDGLPNVLSAVVNARAARDLLEDARVRIARLAGVKSDAVLFTAGATEANALAILGFVRARRKKQERMHVLYLPSAHASTQGCMEMLAEEDVAVEPLLLTDGRIDLEALKSQVRPETVLVALDVVCGETGTRFDTRGVRQVLDKAEVGHRIHLHADASQLPLVESFQLTRIASDTLTLDSQKVGGVRGVGALIAPRQIALAPLIKGGGQERGLRPGTESAALASAFAIALEEAGKQSATFSLKAEGMHARLLERLKDAIPDLLENGGKNTVPHILNVSLPGRDTDYLIALLDEAGFAVSTRSACATDEEGSVAVLALTGDAMRASSTLRISWGPGTPERDLDRFREALVRAVRFMDANAL